ncbi:D-alanine--poly(phosphoribitol) ligase subunit DltA [Sporolactobacillus shoreicorticis]|uniref:D-alanine--D-alanyl carrier protein ligase n=1 Tax=Sporolactobacillus shoreicorticis TaxID=1923877 RepID=A0ABW5S2N8_9BACL|nr:D-alanine--poly(phosphoribitol) ligase subunit DltA [Sporolactobacillus shoreicorticis]MCO7124548.1 D-alanine--poly(phosphoribitol) ligase subunit DltA [Sporolactobacillus shoreicorticis]
MDILDQIENQAVKTPRRICYTHRQELLTFGLLKKCSDALACWLINRFGDDHSPVIVHGHMQPMMLVLFLACAKSGHAYIPADQSIPSERIRMITEGAKTKLIFSAAPKQLPETNATEVIAFGQLDQIIIQNEGVPARSYEVKNEDTFYIIYTSGSTGRPKGVQISRRALTSFTEWMQHDFGLEEGLTFMNQAPYSFDLSVMDLYPSLTTGGTLWAVDKQMIANPKELFTLLAQSEINIWTSTPSFAEMCLMEPSFSRTMLPHVQKFLFCGETLPLSVASRLKQRFPEAEIINTYGPTETTVAVTKVSITQKMINCKSPFPVGRCKPDCRIYILGEDGVPKKDGQKGEIVICGPSVGSGYLNDPEKTRASFDTLNEMLAYHTHDLGIMCEGMLYYFGRIDHQIKLHGFRMELEEIEHALSSCRYVKYAIVTPIKRGDRYDHLAAVVVAGKHPFDSDYAFSAVLRKALSSVLPSYMIPRKFIYRRSLPMTANGKIDRGAPLKEVSR